jgi:hypothetical protein
MPAAFSGTHCGNPQSNLTAEATEHDESMSHIRVNDRQSLPIATGFLHHLATSYSILQHLTASCNILQHLATSYSILQHLTASCNILQPSRISVRSQGAVHVQTLSAAQRLSSRSMMPLSAPPDARRSPGHSTTGILGQ